MLLNCRRREYPWQEECDICTKGCRLHVADHVASDLGLDVYFWQYIRCFSLTRVCPIAPRPAVQSFLCRAL